MNFVQRDLAEGVRLHLCETEKFKTLNCKIFIQQNLEKQTATSTALIPLLLRRGSGKFPSTLEIAKELENLYAANFSSDVLKIGERQILELHYQMIDSSLLPEGDTLLERGLETFWDIITNPAGSTEAFIASYYKQEKQSLKQDLEGLVNEKRSYAIKRAIETMCANEPFGIYKYGEPATLENLKNEDVRLHYGNLLSSCPMDIFLVGRDLDRVAEFIGGLVEKRESKQKLKLPQNVENPEEKVMEENMNMQQAVLIMGYRTNCTYLDDDYYDLVVGNGILGGFAHSKLFMNVREKASLAYYVGSNLEGTKGILLINAGINGDQKEQAMEIIREQISKMKAGEITEHELEQTKQGLISSANAAQDSPAAFIDRNLIGLVNGQLRDSAQVIEAIRNVRKEGVIKAMERLSLDTTYILSPNGQED